MVAKCALFAFVIGSIQQDIKNYCFLAETTVPEGTPIIVLSYNQILLENILQSALYIC